MLTKILYNSNVALKTFVCVCACCTALEINRHLGELLHTNTHTHTYSLPSLCELISKWVSMNTSWGIELLELFALHLLFWGRLVTLTTIAVAVEATAELALLFWRPTLRNIFKFYPIAICCSCCCLTDAKLTRGSEGE